MERRNGGDDRRGSGTRGAAPPALTDCNGGKLCGVRARASKSQKAFCCSLEADKILSTCTAGMDGWMDM